MVTTIGTICMEVLDCCQTAVGKVSVASLRLPYKEPLKRAFGFIFFPLVHSFLPV